ncbi:MAG: small ribosomal subunit biogenesis GTPase RsgA, partial [Pseudomonadota bacterium]
FGKHAIVENTSDRSQHKCFIRRTIDSVVCGDRVVFRKNTSDNTEQRGVIEAVETRSTVLTRPDFYDGIKPIAANVEQIIIVSAILPTFSTHIIDRYLVACEDAGISPVIIVNKIELLDEDGLNEVMSEMDVYTHLGYPVHYISCKTGQGITELIQQLHENTSVFVGQSGVGKSSIVNQILPDAEEAVGEISVNSGLGQHTTTTAKLVHLENGGEIIDSPGVREFGLWHIEEERIARGFIEFREYLGGCKFKDCRHLEDPGCLITQAVESGNIAYERYLSFAKIIESLSNQKPANIKT